MNMAKNKKKPNRKDYGGNVIALSDHDSFAVYLRYLVLTWLFNGVINQMYLRSVFRSKII